MVQRIDTITAASWQMKHGAIGEVVTDLEDIDQCIGTIVSTERGEVPGRPDFGVRIHEWIDTPLHIAAPNIVREVFEAVAIWEPRAVVEEVNPTPTANGFEIDIVWRPAAGGPGQSTVVSL